MGTRKQQQLDALERLKKRMVQDIEDRSMPRRYRIALSIPAHFHQGAGGAREVVDPAVLRQLDGCSGGGDLAEYIWPDDPLHELSLGGGEVTLHLDASSNDLRLVSEYRAPRPLGEEHIRQLVAFTRYQWNHGVGESFRPELPESLKGLVRFDPRAEPSVHAYEVGDGSGSAQREAEVRVRIQRVIAAIEATKIRIAGQSG